ncbi:MAG: hypothetical protein HZB98_04550 [Bacteroidia bacterium]|nr:hypothetical protein [Bacteroidia bacterium]
MISAGKSFRTTFIVLCISILTTSGKPQDNKGNPIPHFLFPQFKEGIVIMKDGQKFTAMLNYNMVEERMITEHDGIYRYSKNPLSIERILVENRLFIPYENAFYEILSSGSVTLFLQNKANFTPKGNDVGYGAKNRSVGPTASQRFELTPVTQQYGEVVKIDLPQDVDITPASVYWVSKGDQLEKFSSERQFIKLFPEYEKELKEFFRIENINIRKREDVIKLGNFCNETMKK